MNVYVRRIHVHVHVLLKAAMYMYVLMKTFNKHAFTNHL